MYYAELIGRTRGRSLLFDFIKLRGELICVEFFFFRESLVYTTYFVDAIELEIVEIKVWWIIYENYSLILFCASFMNKQKNK